MDSRLAPRLAHYLIIWPLVSLGMAVFAAVFMFDVPKAALLMRSHITTAGLVTNIDTANHGPEGSPFFCDKFLGGNKIAAGTPNCSLRPVQFEAMEVRKSDKSHGSGVQCRCPKGWETQNGNSGGGKRHESPVQAKMGCGVRSCIAKRVDNDDPWRRYRAWTG